MNEKTGDMTVGWTTDPAEQDAIAAVEGLISNFSELLHAVPEARYLDPAGGFDPAV